MSKFKKLFLILFIILVVEMILIYTRYQALSESQTINKITNSKVIIVVDVTSNYLTVFKAGTPIKTYQCAGGKPTTPSPIGTWRVVNKAKWGDGFGGYWMGLNVPWGKYGIHGTIFPTSIGWCSSHGCIRMKNSDVAELYKIIPYNTAVIIWAGPYGNFGEFTRTLKPGMTGADVYELQLILKDKGYYKANADGIYGEYFKQVINKYQKDNNLPIADVINYHFYSKLGVYLMD